MAKRQNKKPSDSPKGDVITWRLSPLRDLLLKYVEEAGQLKQAAAEQDDIEFLAASERILKALNQARSTLRLCPQNQFRNIELKAGAKVKVKDFVVKKHAIKRGR
jgi:hypothetical protein